MTPDELFGELRARVLGRPVRSRRLAGNSLLLYIDRAPGEKAGVTFWLEPTWHLRGPDRVLTGSREAQHDPESDDPDAGFRRAAQTVDVLVNRIITDVWVEPVTGDLQLELDGGLILRTFVADPTDEELWHVSDNVSGVVLCRAAAGFELRTRADA